MVSSHTFTCAGDPSQLLSAAHALASRLIRRILGGKAGHLRAVELLALDLLRSGLIEDLKALRPLHLLRHLQILSIHVPFRFLRKEQVELSLRLSCDLL